MSIQYAWYVVFLDGGVYVFCRDVEYNPDSTFFEKFKGRKIVSFIAYQEEADGIIKECILKETVINRIKDHISFSKDLFSGDVPLIPITINPVGAL